MAVSGLFTFIDQLFVYYAIGVCAVVYDTRVDEFWNKWS